MSDAELEALNRRIATLEFEVNSLKTQIGVVGTTQYAVVQILDRLERVETVQTRHSTQLDNLQSNVAEILRILRDRNGGTGI